MSAPEEPRRPGAWPAGCRRPTPVQPQPPEAWQAAVDEYRAMTDEERRARGVCECGCNPGIRPHTRREAS